MNRCYTVVVRDTTVLEKLLPSVINAAIAATLSLPVWYFFGFEIEWKLATIAIFYLMQIGDTHEHFEFRCFGMRIFGTVWARKYSRLQRNIYSVLYTLSFSTLFFQVTFPFDLFLFNMLFLQLPAIYLTGTTVHGLLSGGMRSKTKKARSAYRMI